MARPSPPVLLITVAESDERPAAVEYAFEVGDARRVGTSDSKEVVIRLSRDEALVLFEWLHRSEDEGGLSQPVHHGEQVALWNLSALLERELVEPFADNYLDLLSKARDRLGGRGE